MDEHKRKTIAAYDAQAERFAASFKEFADSKEHYEVQRFTSLVPGKRVLDLGCGAGDYAVHFQQAGLDVACVDLSSAMVGLCRQKGLNAQVMDIEELQFPPQSFDGIWAVTSLLHIRKERLPAEMPKNEEYGKES